MAATSLTTYLWFDSEALEAAEFYVSLFPNSRLGNISYYQADELAKGAPWRRFFDPAYEDHVNIGEGI